jgi:hypothetical protein
LITNASFKQKRIVITYWLISLKTQSYYKWKYIQLRPESRPFEDEIIVTNLRTYKSPKTDQIPAELIQAGVETYSEIHTLNNSILNKENCLINGRSPLLYQFTRRAVKLSVVIIKAIMLSASYNILLSRLSPYVDVIIGDHHCGFRRNTRTADQIFCIRHIQKKKWECSETVHQDSL